MVRWVLLLTLIVLSTGCTSRRVGVYTDDPPRRLVTDGVVIDELKFEGTPLIEALAKLSVQAKLTIVLDGSTVESAGIEPTLPITAHFRNARLDDVLWAIGRLAGGGVTELDVEQRGSVLLLTTAAAIPPQSPLRMYDIASLVRAAVREECVNASKASTQPSNADEEYMATLMHGMRNATGTWSESSPDLTVIGRTLHVATLSRIEERAARGYLDAEARRLRVAVRETAVRYETPRE